MTPRDDQQYPNLSSFAEGLRGRVTLDTSRREFIQGLGSGIADRSRGLLLCALIGAAVIGAERTGARAIEAGEYPASSEILQAARDGEAARWLQVVLRETAEVSAGGREVADALSSRLGMKDRTEAILDGAAQPQKVPNPARGL